MEQEFKDKIKEDAQLQTQLLDILKGTDVGKAYTETVAKNYFEQNIGQEHRKIYDFVDDALTKTGLEKPDGIKTSEWVNMVAQQNKELSEKLESLKNSSEPDKLVKQLDELKAKHKKEKQYFTKTAQQEIEQRDTRIQDLINAQSTLTKQTEIQNVMSTMEFNKGLDADLIKDIINVKTQILIHNATIEDGKTVWNRADGTPFKEGILNASLDTILKSELNSVLHRTVAGGNAATQNSTATFNGQQVIVDPNRFKTQETFLNEFNKVAQSKGIAKGEDYDKLYWEAFERYNIKDLKEY